MATHAITPAQTAINTFQASTQAGQWGNLQKLTLLNGLGDRVNNPYSVDQDQTFLCGPAAIIFALIKRDPVRYVQICQRLFETGSFGPPLTASKTFTASNNLRAQAANANVPQIDWMLTATLRESENLMLSADSKLGQLTLDDAMKLWATELLLDCHHTETTTCYIYGEMAALQKAQLAITNHGVAFLLIDSVMLNNGINVHMPTHWIAVAEPITITSAPPHIHFQCYTWAQEWLVDEDQPMVLKNLYTVVTAW